MASPGWRGEERAWAGPPHLIADEKVRLALEDEESVDEVVMGMRVDALEFGREGHLEERQLRQLGLDQMRSGLALDAFSLAGSQEDRVPERPPAVLGRIELIEVLVAAPSQDVRRRRGERAGTAGQPRHVRPEPEVDLALEDVERVGVLPVDVGLRAFLAGLVAEPRHDQLFEVAEDPQRPLGPVGGRLALAGG